MTFDLLVPELFRLYFEIGGELIGGVGILALLGFAVYRITE